MAAFYLGHFNATYSPRSIKGVLTSAYDVLRKAYRNSVLLSKM